MNHLSALILSMALLIIAIPASAQDITGQYRMEGANPNGQGVYQGQVAVTQTGATYQVTWAIGTSRHVGTAILKDDVLSVVYQPEGTTAGIAVYTVGPDGVLSGAWTTLGGKVVGTEKWTPDKGI